MANILLTGGTGFVGSHLIAELCRHGHRLWCITRHPEPFQHVNDSVAWIDADLLFPESYADYLKKADCVFHLAGMLHARRKEDYYRTNVLGTETLLKACKSTGARLSKFVHMSSIAAMGPKSSNLLLRESDPCIPNTEYGKSKWMAEQIALRYISDIPIVILRPSFIYGRGDRRGLTFLQSLFNQPISSWNRILKTISLCHVSDVVQSCLLSIQEETKSGELFIISDGENYTWNHVVATLEQVVQDLVETGFLNMDHERSFFHQVLADLDSIKKEQDHGQYWGCDIHKAIRLLKYHPQIALRKGACDTILWYMREGLLNRGGDAK